MVRQGVTLVCKQAYTATYIKNTLNFGCTGQWGHIGLFQSLMTKVKNSDGHVQAHESSPGQKFGLPSDSPAKLVTLYIKSKVEAHSLVYTSIFCKQKKKGDSNKV